MSFRDRFPSHKIAFHWFWFALHFHMSSMFEVELRIEILGGLQESRINEE